ncbi:MAG: hypothetical protein IJB71_04015 [Bacilli bacterium]|nr:hypothetical protein [Bacilli bacterium]
MTNVLWGIVFIVVGIIFGLNILEITNINLFFDGWWTLFIIIPCFIGLFKTEGRKANFIGLVIGICLLLGCQNVVDFELMWKLLGPIVLVLIGISFLFKDNINKKVKNEIKKLNKKIAKEYSAIFSEQKINFNNEEVPNSELLAIFGSLKCDLKEADIKDKLLLNISAIFGNIVLYIPENVNVKISAMPIFGSVKDNRATLKETKATIYIDATSMFGSIEIK